MFRLMVTWNWREPSPIETKYYEFSTEHDAEVAQKLIIDATAPLTDDLFCSSVIEEVA